MRQKQVQNNNFKILLNLLDNLYQLFQGHFSGHQAYLTSHKLHCATLYINSSLSQKRDVPRNEIRHTQCTRETALFLALISLRRAPPQQSQVRVFHACEQILSNCIHLSPGGSNMLQPNLSSRLMILLNWLLINGLCRSVRPYSYPHSCLVTISYYITNTHSILVLILFTIFREFFHSPLLYFQFCKFFEIKRKFLGTDYFFIPPMRWLRQQKQALLRLRLCTLLLILL